MPLREAVAVQANEIVKMVGDPNSGLPDRRPNATVSDAAAARRCALTFASTLRDEGLSAPPAAVRSLRESASTAGLDTLVIR